MSKTKSKFTKKIKSLLKENNIQLKTVSKKIGVSPAQLSSMFCNRKPISYNIFRAVFDLIGAFVDDEAELLMLANLGSSREKIIINNRLINVLECILLNKNMSWDENPKELCQLILMIGGVKSKVSKR